MTNTETTCDHCQADLSTTGNCEAYRLLLAVESIPSRGGVVTLLNMVPPITHNHHFCGIECLKKWLTSQ